MTQELKFHVFETRSSKVIGNFMSFKAVLNKIKKGDDYTPAIQAIRTSGTAHPDYDNIIDGRESIIWNATSGLAKSSSKNVNDGMIHMFTDSMSDEVLRASMQAIKELTYVIAAFISIDGKGVECLIRCDELTSKNFEEVWNKITNTIAIDFAFKALDDAESRPLSFDPGIYINYDAVDFNSKAVTLLQAVTNPVTNLEISLSGQFGKVHNDILYTEECLRLAPAVYNLSRDNVRYETEYLDEFFEGAQCKQSIEGFPYLEINTHYKVTGDKRQATMFHQAGKLVWLNPLQDEAYLVKLLYEINFYQCKPRLPYWEIRKILLEQYQRYQNEDLDPKFEIRYTVCKHDTTLTLKERQQLNVKMNHVIRTTKTYNIIREELKRLMDAGVKILQVDLIKISTKAERTVKEYWKRYFKAEVEQYNQKLEIM